ncbi:MAG: NUDIX domain-containing protein, partial [Chloroflexi bacterium]|nr:NUDIX domain-containing protein [Chloroflexota bacterium]
GETRETAVLREIEEESGITAVRLIKQLGSVSWQNEKQHFFLLETTQPLPETFVHIVHSHDADNGLRYAYCWLALTASLKTQLVYGGGVFVDDLLAHYQLLPVE